MRENNIGENLVWLDSLPPRCVFYIDGKNVKQQKLSDYVYFVMQEADHQLYTDSVTEELRLGNKRIPSIDEKCLKF